MTLGDPVPLLSWRSEQEWGRLARLVSFEDGFWLGLVFSSERSHTLALRNRLEALLSGRARRLHRLDPDGPDSPVRQIFGVDADAGDCVWLELDRGGDPSIQGSGWEDVLATLNRRRDELRRNIQAGLLLVLPAPAAPLLPFVALDLWSVRAITAHLGRDDANTEDRVRQPAEETAPPSDSWKQEAGSPTAAEAEVVAVLRSGRALLASDPAEVLRLASNLLGGPGVSASLRARTLVLKGRAAAAVSDHVVAYESFQAALSDARKLRPAEHFETLVGAAAAALALGRPGPAARHLSRGVTIQREASRGRVNDALLSRAMLAWTLCELGDRLSESGDLGAAAHAHDEALTIRRQLAETDGTAEATRELLISLNRVGNGRRDAGDLPTAAAAHAEALTVARHLVQTVGNLGSLHDLGVSLDNVGDNQRDVGDLTAATAAHAEALAIRQSLSHTLANPASESDLSISLTNIGDDLGASGDRAGAAEAHAQALAIRRRLANDIGDHESLRFLSISLNRIGDSNHDEGDHLAAMRHHDEALKIRRRLAEVLDTPEAHRYLSISLSRVGDDRRALGDLARAAKAHAEALAIAGRIASQLDTPQSLRDLSTSLNKMADDHIVMGNAPAALDARREAVLVARRLADTLATPQALSDLIESLDRLGQDHRTAGDLTNATAAHREALAIARSLADRLGTPQAVKGLAHAARQAALTAQAAGDPAVVGVATQAVKAAQVAMDFASEAGPEDPAGLLEASLALLASVSPS